MSEDCWSDELMQAFNRASSAGMVISVSAAPDQTAQSNLEFEVEWLKRNNQRIVVRLPYAFPSETAWDQLAQLTAELDRRDAAQLLQAQRELARRTAMMKLTEQDIRALGLTP